MAELFSVSIEGSCGWRKKGFTGNGFPVFGFILLCLAGGIFEERMFPDFNAVFYYCIISLVDRIGYVYRDQSGKDTDGKTNTPGFVLDFVSNSRLNGKGHRTYCIQPLKRTCKVIYPQILTGRGNRVLRKTSLQLVPGFLSGEEVHV